MQRKKKGDDFFAEKLQTNYLQGIPGNSEDITRRISYFGSNEKKEISQKSHKAIKIIHYFVFTDGFLDLKQSFLNSLNLFPIKIFALAIILSIMISVSTKRNPSDSWIEGFAIFLAMLICVLVATITEYQIDNEFLKLNRVFELTKEVLILDFTNIIHNIQSI